VGEGAAVGDLAERFLSLSVEDRAAFLAVLGADELAVLDADIDARVRSDLADWCRLALGPLGQYPARHHLRLIAELEAIASGENDRLMVLMPPGSAKSTYISDLFPAWFLARFANQSVIGASHTSGLAAYFSKRVQGRIEAHGETLGIRLVGEAVESWSTSNGGEYKAVGVGGAIAGRRADLMVIDDPIKSREEADNQLVRDRIWAWYIGDMIGRLKPTGRIVLVMTRWHHGDLAGQILELDPGRWRVLNLPAIAEANDALGREVGEALWPEWEPLAKLLDKRRTVGGEDSRDWTSQFQQRPSAEGGMLFMVKMIGILDQLPPVVRRVRAWDLAATEAGAVTKGGKPSDPDWTVGLLLAKTDRGRYVVEDVVRFRGKPEEVERRIVETAAADGWSVIIGLPQDPGQAGKSQISYLTAQLAGHQVFSSKESGSKATRAAGVIAQANVGNVSMMSAAWNAALISELREFPAGRNDDQVDALSRAFAMLVVAAKPARNMPIGIMGR
jgi:predicted phage terminase large subunit-like protein